MWKTRNQERLPWMWLVRPERGTWCNSFCRTTPQAPAPLQRVSHKLVTFLDNVEDDSIFFNAHHYLENINAVKSVVHSFGLFPLF